jgi:DNA ligase-3
MATVPFATFVQTCALIEQQSSYIEKIKVLRKVFYDETGNLTPDIALWIDMLVPSSISKRVYNLKQAQLVKIFKYICDQIGDGELMPSSGINMARWLALSHEKAAGDNYKNIDRDVTMKDVDDFLIAIEARTRNPSTDFLLIMARCDVDSKTSIIRLVQKDLCIRLGIKHVLNAIDKKAYNIYKECNDIRLVLQKINKTNTESYSMLGIPIDPMLAKITKCVGHCFEPKPTVYLLEIKYDGERVQVHKQGGNYSFYSRNLKPTCKDKYSCIMESLMAALPKDADMILDGELVAVDKTTGEPTKFGTLGRRKRLENSNIQVCLVLFDCLYLNKPIMQLPLGERRVLLEQNVTPVENAIILSQSKYVDSYDEVMTVINELMQSNLEGVVLKNLNTSYKPGKRHWLKIKRDTFQGGIMADSVDLVVAAAWNGTGKNINRMSTFLMVCRDRLTNQWKTVTKVHTGLTDSQLRVVNELLKPKMKSFEKLPEWLQSNLVPDYIAIDINDQPVWEIVGFEFTESTVHTANNISIRFPRIKSMRHDKDCNSATSLQELIELRDVNGKKSKDIDRILNSRVSLKRKLSPYIKLKNKKVKIYYSILFILLYLFTAFCRYIL